MVDLSGEAGQPASLPGMQRHKPALDAASVPMPYRKKESGSTELLDFEQEQALARRMEWAKSQPNRQREYEQARQTFILANIGLVRSVARHYSCAGFVPDDLVQEGTLGLIQAVDRFDYRQGVRFSTYAVAWIKQAIMKAMTDRGRPIRLPSHVHDRWRHLQQTRQTLGQKLGRPVTNEELAHAEKMTVEQVSQLEAAMVAPIELDAPMSKEQSTSWADLIATGDAEDPLLQVTRQSLGPILQQALQILSPQEQDVVIARYVLDGEEPRSLEELSRTWKRGRERLRQIEVQALQKLRRHNHLRFLAL
jgi:RNA polymerase primary sigma factor